VLTNSHSREWLPVDKDELHWRELTSRRIATSGAWSEDALDFAFEFDVQLAGAGPRTPSEPHPAWPEEAWRDGMAMDYAEALAYARDLRS
jgi:hypothetical protein